MQSGFKGFFSPAQRKEARVRDIRERERKKQRERQTDRQPNSQMQTEERWSDRGGSESQRERGGHGKIERSGGVISIYTERKTRQRAAEAREAVEWHLEVEAFENATEVLPVHALIQPQPLPLLHDAIRSATGRLLISHRAVQARPQVFGACGG